MHFYLFQKKNFKKIIIKCYYSKILFMIFIIIFC